MHVIKKNLVLLFVLGLLIWSYTSSSYMNTTGFSNPRIEQVTGVIHFGVMVNTHGNVTSASVYHSLTQTAMSYVSFTLNQENILSSATLDFTYAYTNGTARNATNALISLYQQGIRFVVGPETDIEFQAVLPVAQSLGMILISPWSASDVLYDINQYNNALVIRPGNTYAAKALVDMLMYFGISRIAIISTHSPYIIDEEVAFNQVYLDHNLTIVYADRISDLNNQTLIDSVVNNAVNTPGVQAIVVFAPPAATPTLGLRINHFTSDIPVFFSRHASEENVLGNTNRGALDSFLGLTDPTPSTEFNLIFQNRGLVATSREGFLHDAVITIAKAIELAGTTSNITKVINSLQEAKNQLIQSKSAYVLNGYSPIMFEYKQIQLNEVVTVGHWFSHNSTSFNSNLEKIHGNLKPVTTTIVSTKGGFLSLSMNPWLLVLFGNGIIGLVIKKRKRIDL